MRWLLILLSMKKYIFFSAVFLYIFTSIFEEFAEELIEKDLHHFDQTIIDWVHLLRPSFTSFMMIFTSLGSFEVLSSLLVVFSTWMIWKKKIWETVFLIITLAGGAIFNLLLKWIFQRHRPTLHRLIEETGYSFPSGHSMSSFIFYGMICMLLLVFFHSWKTKTIFIISTFFIIMTVGLSRIYLGVHYPSDVIAGYAAGGAWLTICLMSLRIVLEIKQKNISPPNTESTSK